MSEPAATLVDELASKVAACVALGDAGETVKWAPPELPPPPAATVTVFATVLEQVVLRQPFGVMES